MVERLAYNERVIGSSPVLSKSKEKIAQLVRVIACRAMGCGFESRFFRLNLC